MTKVGWGQEIPASAGIEMRNRMINDVTPLLIYFFKIFLKLQFGSMKEYFVYLLTNTFHNVLYIGFTNNIRRRIYEHKRKLVYGFTSKYNCTKLLWFEQFKDVNLAIAREKQLKTWERSWKNNLIEKLNPEWRDLAANWFLKGNV
jgi:putative endonuclease